jgi:hypothetical protein
MNSRSFETAVTSPRFAHPELGVLVTLKGALEYSPKAVSAGFTRDSAR